MSCPEFKRKGYLYFFKELDRSERTEFKNHLRECPACREELQRVNETWRLMERMGQEGPRPTIRETILRQAIRKTVQTTIRERLRSWRDQRTPHRGIAWGLSATAVAVILVLLLIRPLGRLGSGGPIEEEIYEWQDDFIVQADWMEQEIDRVKSGKLLASYYSSEDEYSDLEEDLLSPLSKNLNRIRGEVENLMKTIYGI